MAVYIVGVQLRSRRLRKKDKAFIFQEFSTYNSCFKNF